YVDEHGEKWLFKPAAEEFRAHGDEVAYRIGRLIDPEAIEVRVITLDGRAGSIQKWRTGLASTKDFAGVDPGDLSPRDIQQLQREHVVDWLIANHDGHGKQFLRMRDGRVHGIDKGQLFKFLGDDKLSIDYHPNAAHGETEPYYNTVFRAAKEGKVTFDPAATLRYVREVEKIGDDEYRALLAPYAEGRFSSKVKREAFFQAALDRKRNIRRDFEQFTGGVLGDPKFRFEAETVAKPGARLGKLEAEWLADAKRAGWQGKAIPFDVDDIEDQNALVFTETANGKRRTVVRMKIRPEAEAKMLKSLAVTSNEKLTVDVGDTLPEDSFYDTILGGVKTVNHHVSEGDHAYNQEKLESVKKLQAQLRKLGKSSDPDVAAMAKEYLAACDQVLGASGKNQKFSGHFAQYKKQFQSKPDQKKPAAGITARKTKVRMPLRELKNGQIRVLDEHASTGEAFGHSMKDGVQYEIDLGDGITATYKPWVGTNYYAHQGEFELHFDGDPDPKRFEQAMGRLDHMGIHATIASPQDAELLYLQKQAYVLKADTSAEYKKAMQELDRKGASQEERIARLRGFWEERLGVDDLTRMPGYDPMGEHQVQWDDPKRTAGWRHQMRFDISDDDLERELPGHGLYHRLTDDSSLPSFMDEVLGNNGAMASTIEKMRIGVRPGGMSPTADMDTGGATYFFTRIRKLPGQRGGSSSP
ncbi:phage head morphogenesis protein, partial [bacterium]|nr:phage head morphogenesis protein [bacterium]